MPTVLIVEDDFDLAAITKVQFLHAGYAVEWADTCGKAKKMIEENEYDLILLDEILPDQRGTALCGEIRGCCDCPIIFMSCLNDSETIISALRSGGDDFMVKPVDYGEMLARAEVIIKRAGKNPRGKEHIKAFSQFSIDTDRRMLLRDNEEIELSSIEYTLLIYLTENPDKLLLYATLYQNVWNSNSLGDVRTVMVHISNLRKKVDPYRTGIITTVRSAGYIFSDI